MTNPYLCHAPGCPLQATNHDGITGTCHYHENAPAHAWPAITQVFRSTPFRRSALEPILNVLGYRWREDQPIPHAHVKPADITSEEWAAHHRTLLEISKREPNANPLHWADVLQAREEGGEKLHPIQSAAWRSAKGVTMTEAQREALDERLGMQQFG